METVPCQHELPDTHCVDCKADTVKLHEYYMILDELWIEIKAPAHGMLCIGCVENRLGRSLNSDDFTDAPVNWMPLRRSDRLIERLGL